MKIIWHPQRSDVALSLVVSGDKITVNGEEFDFKALGDGATLPRSAVDNEFFCGPVDRIDGEITVNLLLPHGPDASDAARFPVPQTVSKNGAVKLPE